MSKRRNIAIVGTGRIVKAHVEALRRTGGFNIKGICGADLSRTAEAAAGLGLRPMEFAGILGDRTIDVVDIANSSDLHARYGIEAARKGKHLIIEKPIDVSEKKARELIEACEKSGSLLGVVYQCRFDDSAILLRKYIREGVFGGALSASVVWAQRRAVEYYLGSRDGCKGVLMNNGIHFIDLAVFLMGEEPVRCTGSVRSSRPGLNVEDQAEVKLEFSNACFSISMNTNVERSMPTRLEVKGDKGGIAFSGKRLEYASVPPRLRLDLDYMRFYLAARMRAPMRFRPGTHYDVFMNYLGALEGRERVSVDGKEALKSLKAVNAVYATANDQAARETVPE